MTKDRPFLGVMLMLAFCVLAPLGDSIAKLLGGTIALGLLVLARFAIQAAILVPIVVWAGQGFRLPPRVLGWSLVRTVLHILGIGLMFSALQYLPLADALAIAFVMPFIMLILGHFALGEHVGLHRMVACAIGFVGTLLVIQPNFIEVGYPALLPLGVAVIFALFMMVTRKIARAVDPIKLQAISGIQATLMLAPFLIFGPTQLGQADMASSATTWALLLGLGVIGTLAHLFMTWSLRFAPAATLAPMQYLEIPFGTAIGWLIFADLPNGLAALGICITIGAGLYIILRERRLSQRTPDAPATT
ncbi:DMT family transporter [Cognatiyoonia sp. IB215182]|uniref:DMT family transporter n=1 Tax=Cognatiyoonia sp. IB215182 TaxID=3097353 RepID=UPI002A14D861|nr:DMT family transporter [Cognatiyoonia sp. IB215182]MDX8351233.1 DMT family transporter [Cognatiyoonia sp. IB215182]